MSNKHLSRNTKGELRLSASIDNRLYSLNIPETTTADKLYTYYEMNDEEFKKLCKFQNKYNS